MQPNTPPMPRPPEPPVPGRPNRSANRGTREAEELFAAALSSRAEDAAAVRQLSDVASLLAAGGADAGEQRERLTGLDRAIAAVETRVGALRQILNEEKAAVARFETILAEEASSQAELIGALLATMDRKRREEEQQDGHGQHRDSDAKTPGKEVGSDQNHGARHFNGADGSLIGSNSGEHHSYSGAPQPRSGRRALHARSPGVANAAPNSNSSPHPSQRIRNHARKKPNSSIETKNSSRDGENVNPTETGSYESEDGGDHPSFLPVTEEELRLQLRFGPHLCRYDINEALEEIREVVRKKTALDRSLGAGHQHGRTINSLQRRFEYLRQRQRQNAGSSLEECETDAHRGHDWVSEQELRENCAFFRHGESTARATLQLLCSLKRLRQVPGRGSGVVTYLCLFAR